MTNFETVTQLYTTHTHTHTPVSIPHLSTDLVLLCSVNTSWLRNFPTLISRLSLLESWQSNTGCWDKRKPAFGCS